MKLAQYLGRSLWLQVRNTPFYFLGRYYFMQFFCAQFLFFTVFIDKNFFALLLFLLEFSVLDFFRSIFMRRIFRWLLSSAPPPP